MKQAFSNLRPVATRAFSLIELLVVIAITSIILGLLFGPIISSFNLTRRARAVSQAQDAARNGLERLSRELGRATYIYDNGLSPVLIPMNYAGVKVDPNDPTKIVKIGGATFAEMATGATAGDPDKRSSLIAYGRIDLVQPAVRQSAADVIDPTTGQPVGGAELQPGVRGRRVVRYFLGLRNPGLKNGAQRLYTNVYEFRNDPNAGDYSLNPVILYRAEYDPLDGNLFDLDAAEYNSTQVNNGGFNDPAFFYSTKTTDAAQKDASGNPTNGKTYGENWQAIAQPVLVSENVDLLRWNRVGRPTDRGFKDARDPFSPTTTFTPVAVPDDVAAPGFLSSGGVETPAAVPTLYQTRYGAWTYPYTITVLRGSTNYNPASVRTPEPFGTLSMVVDRDTTGTVYVKSVSAPTPINGKANALATVPASNLYALLSPTTRKLFIKTPNLTFQVDPDRGRIETAFPPLQGKAATIAADGGVPSYQNAAGTIADATAGVLLVGDPVPTRFVQDTRDPQAGTGAVPVNQGVTQVDLFDAVNLRYQPASTLDITAAATLASPLVTFGVGGSGAFRGVRIIPGSERVTAPVVDGGIQTSWVRTVAFGNSFEQTAAMLDLAGTPTRYTTVPERLPRYAFTFDEFPQINTASYPQILKFDNPFTPPATTTTKTGISAPAGLAAADTNGKNFVAVTYLWQNNFSRNPDTASATWGNPFDATGTAISNFDGTRPEADIFRVDYATRQQYNINLGARIYDPTDGQAQTIQVTDKVIINNALR